MNSLKLEQMELLQGGGDGVRDIVSGSCAVIGVIGVLGGPVGWGAMAFCAGWGIGAAMKELEII